MKRNLILTFLACGASLMLGTAAHAEDSPALVSSTTSSTGTNSCPPGAWAGHKHGKGGGILRHLTDELSLSGSQQAQVASILEAARPQMKALHEEMKAKRKALIDSVASQISPLLTSDQQTKFSDMVQKFEAGPAGPGGPGGHAGKAFARRGGPGGNPAEVLQHLATQLNLTADQQTQIKPILDAAHTQMQSIHQDTTLTPDQKFAKVKETMEAVHSQINGILTPAQQQQLAALRAAHHGKHGQLPASATPSPASN